MALTAQIQQITQLMTNPAPALTIALPPIPVSPPLVRPLSPLPQTSPANRVPDEPSSTPARCICAWPWSSLPATRKKSSGPLPSSRMDMLRSSPRTSFTRRWTLASSQFNPGLTSNNNSRVNSFRLMQKQTLSTLWRGLCTIKETGQ